MKNYYVYIMTNEKNGTLYIGVTCDLLRRTIEHKLKVNEGFTKQFNLDKLVWYEQTNDILSAIKKEKQMKKWKREYKLKTIEDLNPEWIDLFYEIGGTNDLLVEMSKQLINNVTENSNKM
jgi:putative endonuclease